MRGVTERVTRNPKNAWHPTLLKWQKRVLNNGGCKVSNNTKRALNRFLWYLQQAGIDKKMVAMNCFVPDCLISTRVPLIARAGNDIWLESAASYRTIDLTINGLSNVQVSTYLKTGVIPSQHMIDPKGGFAIYNLSDSSESVRDMGCSGPGYSSPIMNIHLFLAGTTMYWDFKDGGNGRNTVACAAYKGYWCGSRLTNTYQAAWKASSTIPHQLIQAITSDDSATGFVPYEVYIFSCNAGGGPTYSSSKTYSFAAIHDGLDENESNILFNGVQIMRKEIGGGWA